MKRKMCIKTFAIIGEIVADNGILFGDDYFSCDVMQSNIS